MVQLRPFMYAIIISAIISLATGGLLSYWLYQCEQTTKPSNSTAFYETGSLIGHTTTILVSAISLFFPLVTILWSELIDSVFELGKYAASQIEELSSDSQDLENEKIKLNEVLCNVNSFIEAREKEGTYLRSSFYAIMIFVTVLLLSITILSFQTSRNIVFYRLLIFLLGLVVFLGVVLIAGILWLFRVQPIETKLKIQKSLITIYMNKYKRKQNRNKG